MASMAGSNKPGPTDRPILVVDDDAKIVRLVRAYLERDGFAVVTASDGPGALLAIEDQAPALVVLDLMLPGLSARGSTLDRIAGLEDGADDYLPKPFSPAELVLRVRRILGRQAVRADEPGAAPTTAAEPLRHADLVVDPDRFDVTVAGRAIAVTNVEFRVLRVLLEAEGRVLTRDRLLDLVYGPEAAGVLDRTIDVHIGRLRDKLGDDAEQPRYIATVRGVGYRLAPPGARQQPVAAEP
jgi:two-component system, OmpR family, alkaline phosphatase synthesis response regulator PhoP